MNPNRSLHKLLRIIFSEVLMEYFDISGWHDDSSKIEVWLDEKNYMERFDYKSGTVISSGFIDEKVIQEFPLRGKPVYLHVVSNYDIRWAQVFKLNLLYFVGIHKRKTPKIIDFQSFSSIYFSDSYTLRDSNPGPTD